MLFIKNITIPKSVSNVNVSAFSECSNLQFIKVSKENKIYSNYENDGVLYYRNVSLLLYPSGNKNKLFKVPSQINTIGSYSFFECHYLETVIIGNNVTFINNYAFCSSSLMNITIPDSVSSIGSNICFNCSLLKKAKIGNKIKRISNSAFQYCSNLTSVSIGSSVKTIGNSAFCSCSSLESITFWENLQKIEDYAFANCNNLKCIYFYGNATPEVKSNSFSNLETSVLVTSSYSQTTFGNLQVSQTAVNGCKQISSITLTQSNNFTQSNSFTQSNIKESNAFIQSNTFSMSFPLDLSLTHSFVITFSISIKQTITLIKTFSSITVSFTFINSLSTYIRTELLFYEYSLVHYENYLSFYSDFYTLLPLDVETNNGLSRNVIIGLVCGSIAFVLLIMGIIIFLVHYKKSNKKSSDLKSNYLTSSDGSQSMHVSKNLNKAARNDVDQWI